MTTSGTDYWKRYEKHVFLVISADEVADLSNREQMSLVVRIVDKDKNINEEFLGFVQYGSGTDGATLTHVLQKLQDGDLEWKIVEARHTMVLAQWQAVSEEFLPVCILKFYILTVHLTFSLS